MSVSRGRTSSGWSPALRTRGTATQAATCSAAKLVCSELRCRTTGISARLLTHQVRELGPRASSKAEYGESLRPVTEAICGQATHGHRGC
jgi:hypothetical protein